MFLSLAVDNIGALWTVCMLGRHLYLGGMFTLFLCLALVSYHRFLLASH